MLNALIFANSLAATIIIFRIFAVILSIIAPNVFGFTIRSFSLGLIGNYQQPNLSAIIISIIVPALAGWLLGYVWSTIYNKWTAPRIEPITTTKKKVKRKASGKN